MRIHVPPTAETNAPPHLGPAAARSRRDRPIPGWWPWAVGALLGLIVLGPGLGGGSLLSLDLLVTPHIPVPNGMYGLGPALSQRVPLFAILGLGSAVVGGPVITKVLIVVFLAAGFAGAARLARTFAPAGTSVGVVGQLAAGLLWAVGPFALTRVAVGHINLLWVIAVLPWVLPRLCRPADHLPSTFIASVAMAIGGPGGGTLGVATAVIALVLQPRPRRYVKPLVAILVPQLIWVAPTAVLLWAGAGVSGANGFATHADGVAGWPAVVAGSGFWRADYQVGATGAVGAVAGVLIAALALVGGLDLLRRRGLRSWEGAASVVAGIGLLLAVASAVPGVRDAYEWLTELPIGAPLRESHRFLALWLVWAAPAAALGGALAGQRLRARTPEAPGWVVGAVRCVPLLVALAVSVPGWWGVDGRLAPVEYPAGWAQVRSTIARDPGTVVALPWSEYPALSFADGRQAFNPMPDYLGGDVISSYDPLLDGTRRHQEQVDRRSVAVDRIVEQAHAGRPVASDLAALGVRWVVLAHERGAQDYEALPADPGLEHVLALPDVDLYEVRGWAGPATGPDGTAHDLRRPVPPVLVTEAPRGSVLNVAGAPGWVQGWGTAVQVTGDGRLRLEGGGGVIWFWPALLILAVDAAVASVTIWCMSSRRRLYSRILAPRGARD
ncbi:hypothetical protein [Aquihabitans sp. McL0605]|uniref:hypothetical protein n=1 Tax=Aquihabitans sp. McL0605 TaxID=3415671 RepID=UPI003CF4222C